MAKITVLYECNRRRKTGKCKVMRCHHYFQHSLEVGCDVPCTVPDGIRGAHCVQIGLDKGEKP